MKAPAPSAKLPRTLSRLLDVRDEIMGEGEPDDLRFLHAVLAQCGLPYRAPLDGVRDYQRQNGRATLILQSGFLIDPATSQPSLQGLPYGVRPRLLLIHLCSQALRRASPIIPISDSMSGLMKELGLAVTGGRQGTIRAFKEQLNRLAAARMQLLFASDDRAAMLNTSPISRFDVWFPADSRQRMLWPSEVRLSQDFYESLQAHALPLDPRSIRALQHSARALDCYTWLAHRLPRIRAGAGEPVSWQSLHRQFGGDLAQMKFFRREFLRALRQAAAAYPTARIEEIDTGLRLHRSPPPIASRAVAKADR